MTLTAFYRLLSFVFCSMICVCTFFFFFSSRRRHTRCALVTGVQTCALPISGLGGRPQAIEPGDHDRLMAAVSHLPHVLANILVEGAVGGVASAGPSFRDATRVAGANPDLWRGKIGRAHV